jgi:hypothetical protein
MLYDKLAEYYGDGDREQEQYVREAEKRLNTDRQNSIYNSIIESRGKRFGFPDISVLSKFMSPASAKGGNYQYMWAICNDCKAEYDYRFITCPRCHLSGKVSSGYRVRGSDIPPDNNVIRWNQTSLSADGKTKLCVTCENKDIGYCRFFGNPDWQCSQSDYMQCECKQCCAYHKKANRK